MLKEFHKAFGLTYNDNIMMDIAHGIRRLRMSLIVEESAELISAMLRNDRIEILDGLCDLEYVVYGTGVSFGIEIPDIEMQGSDKELTHGIVADSCIYLHDAVNRLIGAIMYENFLSIYYHIQRVLITPDTLCTTSG